MGLTNTTPGATKTLELIFHGIAEHDLPHELFERYVDVPIAPVVELVESAGIAASALDIKHLTEVMRTARFFDNGAPKGTWRFGRTVWDLHASLLVAQS